MKKTPDENLNGIRFFTHGKTNLVAVVKAYGRSEIFTVKSRKRLGMSDSNA